MWCGRNPMEAMKLIEKSFIEPAKTPKTHRRLFLSNLDLTLDSYFEFVTFFDPPPGDPEKIFPKVCENLRQALSRILVENQYDFLAGRLVRADGRLEIDCNGKGVVFVTAKANFPMKDIKLVTFLHEKKERVVELKEEHKQLVKFLHEKIADGVELKEKPLMLLQLTQFKCGGLAFASLCNHCALDRVATRDFLRNLAAATRGKELVIVPNPDRTIFKARSQPKSIHQHYEYWGNPTVSGNGNNPQRQPLPHNPTHLIYLSSERISGLKAKAIDQDGSLKDCTSFLIVAAKIWKARSMAMELSDRTKSKMLFPVDVREKMVPKVPKGFAGNALVHGYARKTVSELKKAKISWLVIKVKEGLERLKDEYVRSGIDWLERKEGVLGGDESFLVVDWGSLGIEGEYKWGKVKCFAPIMVKPGLVILLPGHEAGGMNICLELPPHQMKKFSSLMMED